jgi:hypothetical protein
MLVTSSEVEKRSQKKAIGRVKREMILLQKYPKSDLLCSFSLMKKNEKIKNERQLQSFRGAQRRNSLKNCSSHRSFTSPRHDKSKVYQTIVRDRCAIKLRCF